MTETSELTRIPAMVTVRCHECKRELAPGETVKIADSGAIVCLACVSKRQNAQKPVGPTEFKA
jgi:DNA-directed RNA polymerase subunit RPC12/RpoP